jgi:hypothetical protein
VGQVLSFGKERTHALWIVLAACMLLVPAAARLAQSGSDPGDDSRLRTGRAAFGDWRADAPLVRRKITMDDLPKPFATRSANNFPRIVGRSAALPKVPPGFQAGLFASDLKDPRALVVALRVEMGVVGRARCSRAARSAFGVGSGARRTSRRNHRAARRSSQVLGSPQG